MQIALIPPISMLDYTYRTRYQLMLPQLYESDPYTATYREHCEDPDTYVILDNGAAEADEVSQAQLVEIGWDFGVDELVIPDVIGNKEETIKLAKEFNRYQQKHVPYPFQYMFVIQGQTLEEFMQAARWAYKEDWINVIGIPRHALETLDNNHARMYLANKLTEEMPRNRKHKLIHFLGGSHRWAQEIKHLTDPVIVNQTFIRGMDTSMPFNYAYERRFLDTTQVKRPKGYFDLPVGAFDESAVQVNIDSYIEWSQNANA